MSKLGKKYTLQSVRSGETKAASLYFKDVSTKLTMTEFKEEFNNLKQYYEGKIVFSGDNKYIKQMDRRAKESLPSGPVADTLFNIDTHYEELKEIDLSFKRLGDAASLLSYRGPLEYNFLIKNYENYLKANPAISETALPNFYSVLTKSVEEENYLGFDGTSFYETPAAVINPNINNEPEARVIPSKIISKGKQLSLDVYLDKFNSFKEQFPFYTDITFDTHELDERSITSVLHKKDLLTSLLEAVATNSTPTELFFNTAEKINARSFNVDSFLKSRLEDSVEGDFTFIFDINQRIHNKSRTFIEVLNGDKEYTEVVGYHLRKYDGTSSKLLQEWYLPNLPTDQMKWVDTQIKYDKLYTYKLDPIVLSFTTVYEFQEFLYSENSFTINFINRPIIKIFTLLGKVNNPKENLGASYTNKLLDYPPLEPEVEIIPFIGVPDRIKINFNTAIGQKTVAAVDFSPEEDIKKDELRRAQNRDTEDSLLTFQSDDPAQFIDVYRLDKKPKTYSDFVGNILQVLSTNGSAGASFIDNIEPNKKYYYIGRCVDFHDNISNPTLVYEVEIQQDGNLILPIIRQVDFDRQEAVKQETKTCRRYIKIQPAIRHRVPNEAKTNSNEIELGLDEQTPWNKTFKLRLTSKSSGKKIDVNFTFKYNKPS
jgi:hypothetical protein